MTIFVSDTHFGRSPGDDDRTSELDLISCLDRSRPLLDALYLVGDIFEHYVEYRHVVPKGFVRFQAFLAGLTDGGLPVKYIVGNHDPWHRDYFRKELGIDTFQDHTIDSLHGFTVFVAHGDGMGPDAGVYRLLKPVLRHPVPVSLYRGLLPADVGVGIAKWYSRHFRSESIDERRTASLRRAAMDLLAENPYDLVVLGHSHVPELIDVNGGTYVNCGCWYSDRTVAILDEKGPALKRWVGSSLVDCDMMGSNRTG